MLKTNFVNWVIQNINLQIREGNDKVFSYYQKLGFVEEKRINLGKSLEDDL